MTKAFAASVLGFCLLGAVHSLAGAQSSATVPLLPLLGPTPAPTASAAIPASPTLDIEGGASYENLTNNRGTWNETYLQGTRRSDGGHVLYVLAEDTYRFAQRDYRLTLGDYFSLGDRWNAFFEAAVSPTHLMLPSFTFDGGVQYGSGSGWYEGLTVRHTDYNTQSVNTGILSVENYWKSFRAYYGLTVAQLNGTGPDVESTFALGYYYGATSNNNVTLAYTTGRAVENVGAPTLFVSQVNNWTISGRHWISSTMSIHYGLWTYIQGTSYTRTGGFLGLDYRR